MSETIKYDGRTVTYAFVGSNQTRYFYDKELCANGWKQWDTNQDASYFGVWVNLELLTVFTFAEGDITTEVYDTKEDMKEGFERMEKFYGECPPFAKSWDNGGQVTHYFDARPTID